MDDIAFPIALMLLALGLMILFDLPASAVPF